VTPTASSLLNPNVKLHVAPFPHVSRFTRHGLWPLADCFSKLLEQRVMEETEALSSMEI
jgi:hypothetical protein